MTDLFDAKILADSISPAGYRLTTFEATFNRFILAEWNTHRRLSRNSASSRAIPIPKQIKRVLETPFVPLGFGSAQKGMVAGDDLSGWKAWLATHVWLTTRYAAVAGAKLLDRLGVHKAFANRLLEPWMWHTVIATATEWENFFALRTDKDAQPEFRKIAGMMEALYRASTPKPLTVGEEHLPLVFDEDREALSETQWAALSAGRCARVSYDTHHLDEPRERSIGRTMDGAEKAHWSPMEHQAMVMASPEAAKRYNGNLSGDWGQYRKFFLNEDNFDNLKRYGGGTK